MNKINLAEVIVDVPASATDKQYDYLIPSALLEEVQIGSRIVVPLGSRRLLGYVVGLKEGPHSEKLKAILSVRDHIPPLTEELVSLGFHMAQQYICLITTALQAMVPTVLKGKYKRIVRLGEIASTSAMDGGIFNHLKTHKTITWEEALLLADVTPVTLRKLIAEGVLLAEDVVEDKVINRQIKLISALSEIAVTEALEETPSRFHKQKAALNFFLTHLGSKFTFTELEKKYSFPRETVKTLLTKGVLSESLQEEHLDPYKDHSFAKSEPLELTKAQAAVLEPIVTSLRRGEYNSILLHGVTGSGKTEIYLQAIATVLAQGKEVIALVPEISLTPQMVERFKSRFGSSVAVLHSRLSHGERYDEWRKIRCGKAKIAIGARSAIFAPFTNLGLIIIDEEHEPSYKQDDSPKYHAREVAAWRGEWHNATVLLGSATPAVDTYLDARTDKIHWLQLTERVQGRDLPTVQVVDMRKELMAGNRSIFSRELSESLGACLARKEQAVIFLNRRGFATFVMCRECGETIKCSHCDISLTYHKYNETLRCHYCGFGSRVPKQCPSCNSQHIRHFGTGTQRVEDELLSQFPGINVIRMDVDTTSRKGSHERLLTAFAEGKAEVLLGTQMIAKGLDFPKVTLVGVISADIMLNMPEYSAGERTFQLLMQVGGRAGRHELPGKVVIQTYSCEHYSITTMAQNQEEQFYRKELLMRKRHGYPPFYGLFKLLLSHTDYNSLYKFGNSVVAYCKREVPEGCEILGPVPATVFKVKDRVRVQVLLKYPAGFEDLPLVQSLLKGITKLTQDKELKVSIETEYR